VKQPKRLAKILFRPRRKALWKMWSRKYITKSNPTDPERVTLIISLWLWQSMDIRGFLL